MIFRWRGSATGLYVIIITQVKGHTARTRKFQFETMATERNLANEPEKEDMLATCMCVYVSYGSERTAQPKA